MMPYRSYRYIRLIIIALLFFYGSVFNCFSQTPIGGVVNQYAHVDGIGIDYVEISDEAQFQQFSAGDTVMLIQMKGVNIVTLNSPAYGTPFSVIGSPGKHEFFLIDYVDDPNNRVYFFRDILTSFDVAGLVQLIRVPSYQSAVVTSTLTAAVWDSTSMTGGVLAVFAGKKLTLDAEIDVSGKGFKGAERIPGSMFCIGATGSSKYVYTYSADSSGYKGEGISVQGNDTLFARGKGPDFIGGGGGNGGFSGGGGGSNYGKGGYGGKEVTDCGSFARTGGFGGFSIVDEQPSFNGGLYLGGGGGGSRYSTGVGSDGGNGGGIAIIICDSLLAGADNRILADGETPSTVASGYAGAGGGGAGGSIAIYVHGFSDNGLYISARGGNGGAHAGDAGEGGGGGGGYITVNNVSLTNVTLDITYGEKGANAILPQAADGTDGATATDFKPLLNGFLFNTIWSTVTGTDVDSICSNVVPKVMTGTVPSGSGTFTYRWEYSPYDFSDTTDIAGATSFSYTPTAVLTDTVWIRRVVTDTGATPTEIVDESRWILMIVQPKIENNNIAADTIICYGQTPGTPVTSLASTPTFGNGNYTYGWIDSDNTSTWIGGYISGETGESFTPPVLYDTAYYKRIVTSGRCVDTSNYVTITVLPQISGNLTTRSDSIICEGSLFDELTASAPGGGDGVTYTYLWQESPDNSAWTDAYGVNGNDTYNPDTSRFAIEEQIYYRRRVLSGPYDVCLDHSSPILMTRYHKIENNTIAADGVICAGSDPVGLTGSSPIAGSGSYTYVWQDSVSSGVWNDVGTAGTFDPPQLTDSTWYRRIVNSSVCADTSGMVVINVHANIESNISRLISGAVDTTICYGTVPNTIYGSVEPELGGGTGLTGDYAYQWLYSTDGVSYSEITASGTFADYSPGALTETIWYKRRVISGECMDESLPVRINVLAPITNNSVFQDQTVCYNTVPASLTGPFPDGGDPALVTWIWEQSTDGGTNWTAVSGSSDLQDYSPPALTVETIYRRIVISGENNCCIDTSEVVTVGIYELPTAAIVGVSEVTVCEGEEISVNIQLTGAADWNIVYSENGSMISAEGVMTNSVELTRRPSPSASLSTFDYALFSVVDANGCSATSMTGTLRANVYKNPVADGGGDDAVCGPEYTLAAVPSDGDGTWTFPSQVVKSDGNFIAIDSSFTDASVIYEFIWEESNGDCTDADTIEIEFFNRIDQITAGNDTAFMTFDNVVMLNATALKPFETGEWSVESGSGSFVDKYANTTEVRNADIGLNSYKWSVVNGECADMAVVDVELFDVVVPEGISPNGDGINDIMHIKGLELDSQLAELTIVNGGGNKIYYTTNRDGAVWTEWDGTNSSGNALPEGTYHFILKVTSQRTGVEVIKSGFIILKRR